MQKQNFSQGGFMPQNRQYYRKVKYPDKVAKLKSLVFVRIFLFCSVGIKIQYFPTAPFIINNIYSAFVNISSPLELSSAFVVIVAIVYILPPTSTKA